MEAKRPFSISLTESLNGYVLPCIPEEVSNIRILLSLRQVFFVQDDVPERFTVEVRGHDCGSLRLRRRLLSFPATPEP